MIAYFTKQYQAVPALMQLYQGAGGTFITTRGSTRRAIGRVYPGTQVAMLREAWGSYSAGDHMLRSARAIVTGSPNREVLSRYAVPSYMVFHGTYAFMARPGIDLLRHFDRICVIGPRMAEMFSGSGLEDRLLVGGYLPFLEFPAREAASRTALLAGMGLDPACRTVLYLPRGKPYGSWDLMAEKLLREIPPEYNLIMRPHPSQSVTARVRDRVGFVRLARISRKRRNALIDLADRPLSSLFSVADLLLSDGASAPEESLYYDFPLVFILSPGSSPQAIAAMMRKQGHEEAYIAKLLTIYECGQSVSVEGAVMPAIELALREPGRYHSQRNAYYEWAFGPRGTEKQRQLIQHLRVYSAP